VGSTEISGLTLTMTVWSLAMAQSLQLSSGTRMTILKLQDEIVSGNIAYVINKPYSFLGYLYSQDLGRFPARFFGGAFLGFAACFMLVGPLHTTMPTLLATFVLIMMGFTLNVLISMVIGMLCFWTEDVSAYRWIYDKVQWTFSGMVIPLAMFPDTFRKIIEYTPFGQLFYPAARIFVGYNPGLFLRYLSFQIFWSIVFLFLAFIIYKKGIRNVANNGG
jgi:ABC-2 type transport system permease protein